MGLLGIHEIQKDIKQAIDSTKDVEEKPKVQTTPKGPSNKVSMYRVQYSTDFLYKNIWKMIF